MNRAETRIIKTGMKVSPSLRSLIQHSHMKAAFTHGNPTLPFAMTLQRLLYLLITRTFL